MWNTLIAKLVRQVVTKEVPTGRAVKEGFMEERNLWWDRAGQEKQEGAPNSRAGNEEAQCQGPMVLLGSTTSFHYNFF